MLRTRIRDYPPGQSPRCDFPLMWIASGFADQLDGTGSAIVHDLGNEHGRSIAGSAALRKNVDSEVAGDTSGKCTVDD